MSSGTIIATFARHRVAANLAMVMMVLAGLWAARNIATSLDPAVELPAIFIDVAWPGAAAEDVERLVTVPIEAELRTLPDLQELSSKSSEGAARVRLRFTFEADMTRALDEVKQRLAQIRNFPADIEPPRIRPAQDTEWIASLVVTGSASLTELAPLVRDMERGLLDAGIERIVFRGMPEEEIAIEVASSELAQLHTTLGALAAEISQSSRDVSAGAVGRGHGSRPLRGLEQQRSAAGFAALPITVGSEVTALGNIAEVRQRPRENQVRLIRNGKPAIEMLLLRRTETDALTSAQRLHTWLQAYRPQLPAGVEVEVRKEASRLLSDQLDLIMRNALSGLVLVIAVLVVFLNGRVALWVAAGIPVSFMLALAVYYGVFDGGINIIALLGFIMALGIVVDDAIVVGEDAMAHFEGGAGPLDAAVAGAGRMFVPVATSSLTTLAAFIPLLLVGGVMGAVILTLPTVLVCIVVASLIECFLVLPGHLKASLGAIGGPEPRLRARFLAAFGRLRDVYFKRALRRALDHPVTTLSLAVSAVSLSIALVASGRVGINFVTGMDFEGLAVNVEFAPSSTESERRAFLSDLEDSLQATASELGRENIAGYVQRENYAEFSREEKRGPQFASMDIEYAWAEDRSVEPAAFVRAWRERIVRPPYVERIEVGVSGGVNNGQPDLTLVMRGDDSEALKAAAEQLAAALRAEPGVSNVGDDLPYGREQLIFTLTPAGRALGLTTAGLGRQLRAAYSGELVQIFNRADTELEVRVMLPEAERDDLGALYRFPILTPAGTVVPLVNVATLASRRGIDVIRHSDGRQSVRVSAFVDPEQNNAFALSGRMQAEVLPRLAERYGISYGLSGKSRDDQMILETMQLGSLLTLALIYLILAWVFASYVWPLAIMIAIPFGLTGAIAGHWIMQMDIGAMSLLAFFALTGIVVNDSIVLISFFKRLRERGMEARRAMEEAATARLRAVLLTSLTTIAGLMPLMFEPSSLAVYITPIAVTICWGLAFATLLVLIVVPALIVLIESARARVSPRAFGPAEESAAI